MKQFEKAIFNFIWRIKSEPLRRKVVYRNFLSGGLNLVHIGTKVQALHIKHIINYLACQNPKHSYFITYWLGLSLRELAPHIHTNTGPHSESVPPFYKSCMQDLKKLLKNDKCTNLIDMSVKDIYTVLIENYTTIPNIVSVFPQVNFKDVFKLLQVRTIDKFAHDTLFKIVHEIISVNYQMCKFHIYNSNICTLCKKEVETITHLFSQCTVVLPLLNILSDWVSIMSEGKIQSLNMNHLRLHDIPVFQTSETRNTVLYLLAQYLHLVWQYRCSVKFERKKICSNTLLLTYISHVSLRIKADFDRMNIHTFESFWYFNTNGIFCSIDYANNKLSLNLQDSSGL